MGLNKNTHFYRIKIDSLLDHMDGHQQVILGHRDHTIAQLEEMLTLVELYQTLTLNVVYMLGSKFLELMPKLCQDNGNIKLDHVLELKQGIICGLQDIF